MGESVNTGQHVAETVGGWQGANNINVHMIRRGECGQRSVNVALDLHWRVHLCVSIHLDAWPDIACNQ
jgi:hypothetical protein